MLQDWHDRSESPGDEAVREPIRQALQRLDVALQAYEAQMTQLTQSCTNGKYSVRDPRNRKWLREVLQVRIRRHDAIGLLLQEAMESSEA